MGYPATYRVREFRPVVQRGFQNAAPILRYLLNNAANSNTIIRAYGGINFLQMARIAKTAAPFGKRAVAREIVKQGSWAALRRAPRFAGRLAPWARAALIAVELAELFQRALSVPQQLARGNTLQFSCGGGSILSNTRTAPNCGLSLPKVMPFPQPLGWPNPVQWGWWTQENQTLFIPPTFNCTVWSVWTRGTGLPLNPLQQQPAPKIGRAEKPSYALPEDQPVRGSRPFYSPEWAPWEFPPIAPPMINPQSIPIGVQMPTPAPVPYWLIPYIGHNPWQSPSEQPQRGNDYDQVPFTRPPSRPRLHRRGSSRGIDYIPGGSPGWETVSIQAPGTGVGPSARTRTPPHRNGPPPPKTKEIKGRAPAGWIRALRFANATSEWADWIEALWKTLDRQYKSKGRVNVFGKAKDLYRHYDKLNVETAVKALVRNEIQDFLFGLLGQTSSRAAKARGERFGGLRIDTAGRAMRKLDTGVREGVNDLTDRIMKEVFNETD